MRGQRTEEPASSTTLLVRDWGTFERELRVEDLSSQFENDEVSGSSDLIQASRDAAHLGILDDSRVVDDRFSPVRLGEDRRSEAVLCRRGERILPGRDQITRDLTSGYRGLYC